MATIWFCVMRKPSPGDSPRRHRDLVEEILGGDSAGIARAVAEHLAVGKAHTLELLEPYFRLHTTNSRRFSRTARTT
jgi:DNA-binding GntR family transcriptional regulator